MDRIGQDRRQNRGQGFGERWEGACDANSLHVRFLSCRWCTIALYATGGECRTESLIFKHRHMLLAKKNGGYCYDDQIFG